MPLTRRDVYFLLLLSLLANLSAVKGFILYDSSEENNSTSSEEDISESRIGRVFDVNYWLGMNNWWNNGPKCGPPSTCPVTHCRFDPAVIHGYCCGCAEPFEESPYLCPLSTNCPINDEKLCATFNYRIKCCCDNQMKESMRRTIAKNIRRLKKQNRNTLLSDQKNTAIH